MYHIYICIQIAPMFSPHFIHSLTQASHHVLRRPQWNARCHDQKQSQGEMMNIENGSEHAGFIEIYWWSNDVGCFMDDAGKLGSLQKKLRWNISH